MGLLQLGNVIRCYDGIKLLKWIGLPEPFHIVGSKMRWFIKFKEIDPPCWINYRNNMEFNLKLQDSDNSLYFHPIIA